MKKNEETGGPKKKGKEGPKGRTLRRAKKLIFYIKA